MLKGRRAHVGRSTATFLSASLLLAAAGGCAGGPAPQRGPTQDVKKISLEIVDAG